LKEHPLISHLADKILNVFVSIEVTGQSVGDEIKFNYRKSMHLVLQYIWRIPIHKKALKVSCKCVVYRIQAECKIKPLSADFSFAMCDL